MIHKINILIILFSLIPSIINAWEYDNSKLEIFSKLIPRFVLMSSQKDIIDKDINVCLLYNLSDEIYAKSLTNKIISNNPHGIKNHGIKITSKKFSSLDECSGKQIVFLFNENLSVIKKSVEFFKKRKTILISYNQNYLKSGVDISLYIGRKVLPYVNLISLHKKDIYLDNLLIRVSKIYKESDDE